MKSFSRVLGRLIIAAMLAGGLFLVSCTNTEETAGIPGKIYPRELALTKTLLMDKIKGGWAGQVIGCTFGGPTEFRYCGTMIQDYIPIDWDETRMEWYYTNAPGLYDDIYMDLTFVEVFEKEGLDAPASSHAHAFAHADYNLWHANQAARYNILNGMEPPASGQWENNPHADDIDFQIEADFAGLMNPGMVNSATAICDRVGHIMNYGDGWYGGVYVAAMYSLAFWSDNIPFIVSEALRTIPVESQFYQCIHDVIGWYLKYPDDWKRTWFEVERKWSSDIGCPDGVFRPFDIDAKINAAYIVIGMLYGGGDFGKTLDISTRCGQDSDCNPASAGGILGTILGYDAIPEHWKMGLDRVEDMDFKYTTISLNDTYQMSFRHALEQIKRNGGEELDEEVRIKMEEPVAVPFEKAFGGHFPVKIMEVPGEMRSLRSDGPVEYSFEFTGKGFVLNGGAGKLQGMADEADLHMDVYIDGSLVEEAVLPTAFQARRHELTWKYNLENREHTVKVVWKDPVKGYRIDLNGVIVYGPEPAG
jgi:hypothetical protein